MNREPDPDGGSDIGDGPPADEFDAIVAGWRLEGSVPEWPTDGIPPSLFEPEPPAEQVDTAEQPVIPPAAPPAAPPVTPPQVPVAPPPHPKVLDEHYVPPEPPPLPRLGPPALVGIGLLLIGLVLIITPNWLGVSSVYGLPLGLLGLAAGLGWLVLRLWPDSPDAPEPDEDDDGAVL